MITKEQIEKIIKQTKENFEESLFVLEHRANFLRTRYLKDNSALQELIKIESQLKKEDKAGKDWVEYLIEKCNDLLKGENQNNNNMDEQLQNDEQAVNTEAQTSPEIDPETVVDAPVVEEAQEAEIPVEEAVLETPAETPASESGEASPEATEEVVQ